MLLSQRAYAEHRGVAESAVRRAIESGRITTSNGKIDPVKADKEWNANTQQKYIAPKYQNKDNESEIFQSNRNKRETLDIALKKLDYETRLGKMVSRALAETEAFSAARLSRDKLLTLPDRLTITIGITDIKEFKKIVKAEVTDCLMDLTEFLNGNK